METEKKISETDFPAVQFKLTQRQTRELESLFDLARQAYADDKKGMILIRLQDSNEFSGNLGKSVAAFVSYKYAKRIQKIMGEYWESYKGDPP